MESIFFITASMVLSFGFVSMSMLVTNQFFGCWWVVLAQHQGFVFPTLHPQESRAEGGQELGGDKAQNDQSDILYYLMLSEWLLSCWLVSVHHSELTGFQT